MLLNSNSMAGGGPIQYNELYAKNVQDGIKELNSLTAQTDALFQELAKTITATSGRVTTSLKTETTALQQLKETLVTVDVAQKGAADTLTKVATATDTATTKARNLKDQQEGLNKIYSTSNAEMQRLQGRTKALTDEYNALSNSTEKNDAKLKALSKEITQTVLAQNRLSTAMGNTKKAIDLTEGSYNKMNAELNTLRKELKDLPNAIDKQTGAWNKANPEVQKYLSKIQLLDTNIKKVDATLGAHQRNVGNYSSALSGAASQLASLVAGYVSVYGAISAVNATFAMAVKTDSIRSALEFTFKSAEVADQKLQMLQKTADRLGLEFVSLADSYKSFTGAAIASNFPISEAEKIFNAVSNAGSRLKLTSDQMSGALMALQQMISKGNVQAEELRGQLGERLPGAFAIAARAMGVTETKLGGMMKDGEVLAADLLPKLANELNKTFGGGTDEKVDSLQGSVNRLKNTFSEMVANNSNISKFFTSFIDGIADVFSSIKDTVNSKSWKEFWFYALPHKQGAQFDNGLKDTSLETFGKSSKSEQSALIQGAQFTRDRALATAQKTGSKDDNLFYVEQAKVLMNLKNAWNELYNAKKPVADLDDPKKDGSPERQLNGLELLQRKISDITEKLKLQALSAAQAGKAFAPDPKTLQQLDDLIEKLRFANALGRGADLEKVDIRGRKLPTTQSVTDALSPTPMELQPSKPLDTKATAEELRKALSDILPLLRDSNQIIGEIFGQEFGNLFDQLTNDVEEFAVKGKLSLEDFANTGIAGIRSIDEAFRIGTENRIASLELEKQAQVDIAGTNAVARLAIEKDYNDRIREEKKKQARIDKAAAAFEIVINTAVAVSKATAQTGLFGLPLIPIIVALGAAQLAAVIARPIPQFRHGTQSAPGGLAEVAEEGPEAIQSPSGHLRIAHKRQITYVERGSKVFTAEETKRMIDIQQIDRTTDLHERLTKNLQDGRKQDQISTMAAAFYASRINPDDIGKSVGREIAKLPVQNFHFDQRGYSHFLQTQSTTTKILNDRYSLK